MASVTVSSNRSKSIMALTCGAFLLSLVAGGPRTVEAATDEEIALNLATLLRASRAVISKNQKHINDPNVGDKGLSADAVVVQAKANYKAATGKSPDDIDPSSVEGKLIQAQMQAIRSVMDDAQANINQKGVGLKGFLPAVFARLVTEKFADAAGGKATMKLTAPKAYVRNRANRPDKWEEGNIEKFRVPDYPKDKQIAEAVQVKGKNAYRLILPEYYTESCLACHGDPKGERDITGGKKEGGKLGEVGGAISVVLYK